VGTFQLRPTENILHPNPYVEDEPHPLIVTTMRVFYTGSGKKQELDATKITYSGKSNDPQKMKVIVMLVILALPFAIFGVYKYAVYRNLPLGPPPSVKGVADKAYSPAEYAQFNSNKTNFYLGLVVGAFGVALGGGAYLLYKRRLTVVIGGAGMIMRIGVKNAMEQDKILTMVGAAQTAAKAMAPLAMPQKVIKPPAK
jgi:hypothetical protein